MKKTILCILLFCLDCGLVWAQTLETKVLKAIELSGEGKYDEALQIYDSVIEENPDIPLLYVLKAEVVSKFRRRLTKDENTYQEAVELYNKALDLDPTLAPAYNSRALLNISHQKFDLAIQDFSKVLDYTKGDAEAQFNALSDRGSAKLYAKDYEGAIEDYKASLEMQPGNIGILSNLSGVYTELEQYDKAEEVLLKAREDAPNDGRVLNNLGMLYIEMEDYSKASTALEKAIESAPQDPISKNNLGLVKIKSGKIDEGLKLINESLEIYPENAYAYKHRAMAYIEQGKNQKACEDLNKANALGYSDTFDQEVNELIDKLSCQEK